MQLDQKTTEKKHWLIRLLYAFLRMVLALLKIIIFIVLFVIFAIWLITWIFSREPSVKLKNYYDLRIASLDPSLKFEGKSLPLIDKISTSNFWIIDHAGNIPESLRTENIILAENTDGFTDLVYLALVKLDKKSAQSLSKELRLKFAKEKIGLASNENEYVENALCLDHLHIDMGPWHIVTERKDEFFDFCLEKKSQVEKVSWKLMRYKEDGTSFEYIDITEYVGTTFFTIAHGGS